MELILSLLMWIVIGYGIFKFFSRPGRRKATDVTEAGEIVYTSSQTLEVLGVSVVQEVAKQKRLSTKNETYFNKVLAEKMGLKANVTLDNGLKADMMSDTHAYEIDFGGMKTYEGIGQCLVYAYFSNKKPALIILNRSAKERTLFEKIRPAIAFLGIELTVYNVDRVSGQMSDKENG